MKKQKLWILLVIGIVIILRLIPFLKAPVGYFGYDFGFYLQAAKTATHFGFSGILGGYMHPLLYIAKTLGMNMELFLNISLLACSVLAPLALYFYMKKQEGQTVALLSSLLLAISIPQSAMYTDFLWKNVLAIPAFVVGTFLLSQKLDRKNIVQLTLCVGWLLLTHRTSTIIFLLVAGMYYTYKQIKAKQYKILGIEATTVVVLTASLWHTLNVTAQNLIYNNNFFVREGLFLYNESLVYVFWLSALLAIFGIYKSFRKPIALPWLMLLGLTFFWYCFHLPFYNRILVFFDIALVYFAGFGALFFFTRVKTQTGIGRISLIVPIALIGLIGIFQSYDFTTQKEPMITKAHVQEIVSFTEKNKNLTIQDWPTLLAVTGDDASILWGYAHNSHVKAPGLFQDQKHYEDWKNFWDDENQIDFLNSFKQPLYLYQRSYHIEGEAENCLQQVSENFYKFDCR